MARTAVIAGTASSVAGNVTARQQAAARQQEELETLRRNTVAPPAAATPPVTDDVIDQLTRLGELRASGVLTDEEFADQKARVLGA